MWEALCQVAILGIFVYGVYEYIRLKAWLVKISRKMNCDELVDTLLAEEQTTPQSLTTAPHTTAPHSVATARKRDRLAALVAGGQATQYLGAAAQRLSVDQIEGLSDDEVERHYARYEARLGAAMTQTLGRAALQLYTTLASMVLPIPRENQPKLTADLEADPFVGHALSSASCELYHRYGMFLAPITAALTTASHCRFRASASLGIDGGDTHNGDDTDTQRRGAGTDAEGAEWDNRGSQSD